MDPSHTPLEGPSKAAALRGLRGIVQIRDQTTHHTVYLQEIAFN